MQADSSEPELPGFVPVGLYERVGAHLEPAVGSGSYEVTIHRTVAVGLTEQLRRTLKAAPGRAFFISELARILCVRGPLWDLNAALCKLVIAGVVIKGSRDMGPRTLKTYRWRMPGDD